MPHAIHNTLLPINTQKPTFLRDDSADATNHDASTVTSMAGHCNASIKSIPNTVAKPQLSNRSPSAATNCDDAVATTRD